MQSKSLSAHCQALGECDRCGYGPENRPVISLAAIEATPSVMIVAQAPGRTEGAGSPPFTGRGGRTLFRWLALAGLDEARARREIYIAALTRCYPGPHPGGRGDRVPSLHEQHNCADWLEQELRIIQPRLLIPIGKMAIEKFLPKTPLDQLIGRAHSVHHAGGESIAVPLPHPSGASSWVYQHDHVHLLNRALELLGNEFRPDGARDAA